VEEKRKGKDGKRWRGEGEVSIFSSLPSLSKCDLTFVNFSNPAISIACE